MAVKSRIWKYQLVTASINKLTLPEGSRVVSVVEQFGAPVLYAEVPPNVTTFKTYIVRIVETGGEVPDDGSAFVGTLSFHGGQYMVHAYVRAPLPGE